GTVEMGDADDDDLAQPPVELGPEPRRADEVEPDRGKRRRMQEELINIDQRATPSGADLADQVGKLRVIVFFDVGDTGHGGFRDAGLRDEARAGWPTFAFAVAGNKLDL